tara:strand:+ start:303 stop:713 length:411 start_codon:yes stop_codon:yes gene_type:complete
MARTRSGLKGRRDYGRYYNVPHSITDTLAYRSLSAYSLKLWHDLMLQYDGKNNGRIDAIFSRHENRNWKNGTFYRALDELQKKGFIVKTRQGGTGAMKKICSLYRFTHLATASDREIGITQSGPTNDYKTWGQCEK